MATKAKDVEETDVEEALDPVTARKLLSHILANGQVLFSKHAKDEMTKDNLKEDDVKNVLRAGQIDPAEWENGSWRYRVHTTSIYAVVALTPLLQPSL